MTPAQEANILAGFEVCEMFANNKVKAEPVVGERVDEFEIRIADIANVLLFKEGENDGAPLLMVGRLRNGFYFFINAWRDYTGWDCMSGATAKVSNSLADLLRLGVPVSERNWLIGLSAEIANAKSHT